MGFAAKKNLTKLFISDTKSVQVKPAPRIRHELSDESLMAAYQDGDMQAFGQLLSRHQKPIFNYLYRFLKNSEAAEEAFQEVFLRLIRSRKDYKPSAKFTTWLYTLARHYCIDQLRKKRFHEHSSFEDERDRVRGSREHGLAFCEESQAHEMSSANQLKERLDGLLEELNPEQKEVFLMREVQGLPFEEISQVTHVSVNTVKSRMRYALQFLQRRFKELGVTPED
jgi:RNA polymerase sigma-70 factor (ECF subfamily)